jgi:hypothetical protein
MGTHVVSVYSILRLVIVGARVHLDSLNTQLNSCLGTVLLQALHYVRRCIENGLGQSLSQVGMALNG